MVLEAVTYNYCGPTKHVKRYDTTRAGGQHYRCFDCGRTARRPGFVQTYTHKARDPSVKEQIAQMVLNGAGIRDNVASAVR